MSAPGEAPKSTREPRLAEVLGQYENLNAARFHMPGHKGRGMAGFWRDGLIAWDVTELTQTDNLHAPTGALACAQAECAAQNGAADTFFLVNGSTAGLLAMLLALGDGTRVLLSRDCHKAAISGAVLGGLIVDFVLPAYDERWGMWGMVTPTALDAALDAFPAAAVLITSPNYYGMCADLPGLSAIAHAHGAMLFVDSAHGAHFPYGEKNLPPSPAGFADLWVSSAHKTLNALGQAALLHRAEGCALPKWQLQRTLALVETSSPSYLLTASLDWAGYMASIRQDWDKTARFCKAWAKRIGKLPGLRVLDESCVGRAGIAAQDPTRLAIDVSQRGITGFMAAKFLEAANVYVEMADERRLVCICTPSDSGDWYPALYAALQAMPYGRLEPPGQPRLPVLPPRVTPMRAAALGRTQYVPLLEAAGRVAAAAAGLYPPGVALWTPGEQITGTAAALLLERLHLGGGLFGVVDSQALVCAD